ncbi:hypothetical protein V8F33_006240 [Rhypophila sp. PSN 637]
MTVNSPPIPTMPQHKRNLPSEAERAVPPPSTKKAKLPLLAAGMPPPTTLEEAIKIIDMLKAEQAALVKHLAKTDTDILNASSDIKALMRQGEEGVSHELEEQMEAAGFKRGAVTSDDFSKAMFPYIAEIRNLIDGDNGDELTRLRAGYELLFSLKDCSQGDLDQYVCYDDRPSDTPADELLSDVIRRRKAAGDIWEWERDLESFKQEAESNEGYGIEPWFPKSIEALSALGPDDGHDS